MAWFETKLPPGKQYGLLAEFTGPGELTRACRLVRDAGYKRWDAHSPFPVHGIERAMGVRPTPLPWFVLVFGLGGAAGGFLLQTWTHASAYPLVISGKPLFAWPAYIPVTFELGVLGGALAAVLALFGLSRLPTLYHPLFHSRAFERAANDRFFISIESWDPLYDPERTRELLEKAGATHVETVES